MPCKGRARLGMGLPRFADLCQRLDNPQGEGRGGMGFPLHAIPRPHGFCV